MTSEEYNHEYTRAHKHSSSFSSLSSTFTTPDILEKPWNVDLSAPSPRQQRTRNELLSLTLSRSRFVLRLLSTTFSATSLALLVANTQTYLRTRDSNLIYAGILIWPRQTETIDLATSNGLLGVMAVASAFSVMLMLAGAFLPRVRHVTALGDILATVLASTNIVLAVFAGVFFNMWKPGQNIHSLREWTCMNTVVRHPEVDFEKVCGELGGAWSMTWAVVAAEVLTIVNVILALLFVKRGSNYAKFASGSV